MDKVVGVGLGVAYSKVFDDEVEYNFTSVVPKEARGIGTVCVLAIFFEVLD